LFLELLSTECRSVSVHQLGVHIAVQAKIEKAAWVSAGGLRLLEGVAGLLVSLGRLLCLICRWNTLPCGCVMGVHGALVAGIPGLKSETWGTLRVFPTRRVQALNKTKTQHPRKILLLK
jgi:hypothetical protein